ncbi:ERF family protein [Mesorhizobium sp. WSM4308]|uniref:ERF family protein n=1 Tax=Mesorhizobium sp. WSM4308 TaxID=2029409 RepID=UPI000BB0270D|nr:ERF family protein [Mesorhizobium sp. WSM4308]PBB75169.1 ERF family protein [Mesorhizobium sp. WSM4308]
MNTVSSALIEHEPTTAKREMVAAPSVSVTPMDMIDRALTSNATPETLERLLALQERWEASQARKAFDEAMAAAKAEIPVISKNRVVDFTSSKGRTHYRHEDLAEIARTVNPILSKHGLSYRFRTSSAPTEPVSVTCVVSHRLGYFEENSLVGPRDESGNKNSLQQVGSTLTYLQRMTLKAALGLAAAEDDDAKHAGDTADDGPITSEQAAAIRKLIEETETDIQRFCELMKVESVPDIAASQYERVIKSLEAKKRRVS